MEEWVWHLRANEFITMPGPDRGSLGTHISNSLQTTLMNYELRPHVRGGLSALQIFLFYSSNNTKAEFLNLGMTDVGAVLGIVGCEAASLVSPL